MKSVQLNLVWIADELLEQMNSLNSMDRELLDLVQKRVQRFAHFLTGE